MDQDDVFRRALRLEQAENIRRVGRVLIPGGLVVCLTTALLLSADHAAGVAGGWFAAQLVVGVVRLVLHDRLGALAATEPQRFVRLAATGSAFAGLLWALVPWLGSDLLGTSREAAFTMLMVAGAAAGTVARSPGYAWFPMAFCIPSIVMMAGVILASDLDGSLTTGATVLFYLATLCTGALESQRNLSRSVRLAHEQKQLTESLSAAAREIGRSNDRLRRMVDHDALTGLLNRHGFHREIEDRMNTAVATGRRLALTLVDVDDFKGINDMGGHPAGDSVLREIAGRLLAAAGPDAAVARLGGDEFAVLTGACDDVAAATRPLADVLRCTDGPMDLPGRRMAVGCSFGTAVFPDDAADLRTLMAHADIALYAAKGSGKGRAMRFDDDMRARTAARRTLEEDIGSALTAGDLAVHVQPQVRLADRSLVGLEVLLRWRHPALGPVPPPDVVAAARATGNCERLNAFVIGEALALRRRLIARDLSAVRVAFNVSPSDLAMFPLADLVADVAAARGVSPDGLEVEITEDAILDLDRFAPQLERLRRMGAALAIDDFGAGFSSLAILNRVEIDRIKIDRQFVIGEACAQKRKVVAAVVALGRTLGTEVVAEGIESEITAAALAAMGCAVGQGYHIARPMPLGDLAAWIDAHAGVTAPASPSRSSRAASG